MDRTIMPDGTIVTTVTTIQSRPKADCKLGEAAQQQVYCTDGSYGSTDLAAISPWLLMKAVAKLFSHHTWIWQAHALCIAFVVWVRTRASMLFP